MHWQYVTHYTKYQIDRLTSQELNAVRLQSETQRFAALQPTFFSTDWSLGNMSQIAWILQRFIFETCNYCCINGIFDFLNFSGTLKKKGNLNIKNLLYCCENGDSSCQKRKSGLWGLWGQAVEKLSNSALSSWSVNLSPNFCGVGIMFTWMHITHKTFEINPLKNKKTAAFKYALLLHFFGKT